MDRDEFTINGHPLPLDATGKSTLTLTRGVRLQGVKATLTRNRQTHSLPPGTVIEYNGIEVFKITHWDWEPFQDGEMYSLSGPF